MDDFRFSVVGIYILSICSSFRGNARQGRVSFYYTGLRWDKVVRDTSPILAGADD